MSQDVPDASRSKQPVSHRPEILCLAAVAFGLVAAVMAHAGWKLGFADGERARAAVLIGLSAAAVLAGGASLRSRHRTTGFATVVACLAGFCAAAALDVAAVYFCATARFG